MKQITPCLWFDNQAEEAAQFYTSIFKDSKITRLSRYTEAGQEIHGRPAGSVMLVEFELNGQTFSALNGGPIFKFTEAISLVVECDTQEELDEYWRRLSEGGAPEAQVCGWLKDKFGLSWQIVPAEVGKMMSEPEKGNTQALMTALLQMKKLDLETLRKAYNQ